MKVPLVLRILLQAVFFALVLGVSIPPVPSRLSQVKEALKLVDETQLRYLKEESLAKRLYNFASLEGGAERPYGLHQQLQSQTFYRMMIDHYDQAKTKAIDDAILQGRRTQTPVNVEYRVDRNGQIVGFNPQQAHAEYDRLTAEFWRNHAGLYVDAYLKRLASGQEKLRGPTHDFTSRFSDLQDDKRQVFAHWPASQAKQYFDWHLGQLYHASFGPYVHPKLSVNDADAERRLFSAGASSSSSSRRID
ncbi:uncharacterized protein UTRI_06223 [Ustilago trichophora]|uniref:Uncharacterized protein n=1 Tax=Ustilago trichophora TaxID=86804 RepID=A0A5C3EF29_9BASI|nr:uncharacterized protein UTRI_06223 [Ustilago trichophora]